MINLTKTRVNRVNAAVCQERKVKSKVNSQRYLSPLNTTPAIGSGFPSFFLGIPLADSTMTRSISIKTKVYSEKRVIFRLEREREREEQTSERELRGTVWKERGADPGGQPLS